MESGGLGFLVWLRSLIRGPSNLQSGGVKRAPEPSFPCKWELAAECSSSVLSKRRSETAIALGPFFIFIFFQ